MTEHLGCSGLFGIRCHGLLHVFVRSIGIEHGLDDQQPETGSVPAENVHLVAWLIRCRSDEVETVRRIDTSLGDAQGIPVEGDPFGSSQAGGQCGDQVVEFGGDIVAPRPSGAVDAGGVLVGVAQKQPHRAGRGVEGLSTVGGSAETTQVTIGEQAPRKSAHVILPCRVRMEAGAGIRGPWRLSTGPGTRDNHRAVAEVRRGNERKSDPSGSGRGAASSRRS